MNLVTLILACLLMFYSIDSYPLHQPYSSKLANLPTRQIDQLCSYISQLKEEGRSGLKSSESESPRTKRFMMPFPDMNRFLSTSHKLHHHQATSKGDGEFNGEKHDFHAYLCSITKDSEEMTNFIRIFIEEHGQPPAFNMFESCEQVAKRDQLESNENTDKGQSSSIIRLNELFEFCSNRPQSRFAKRWKHTVAGPMSIDFINQMLESRKVQTYPYSAEMDPYLVGRR